MRVIKARQKITLTEIEEMAGKMFGDLVKGVIDIEKEIIALDTEMHVDEEVLLLEQGSGQGDLWGINLYPELYGSDDFIEFDSMINLRPSQNNRSRGVESKEIQTRIRKIIEKVIKK
ncbi:MAG: DUF5674 family protein [Patescibacteria group bacterium]